MRTRIMAAAVLAILSSITANPSGASAPSHARGALDQIFRTYRLARLDPAQTWRQLKTGRATLELGETSFDLRVTPVTSFRGAICLDCGPGGSPLKMPLAVKRASYQGTVVGRRDSRAFVGVNASSISGMVEIDGRVVSFETANRFDPTIPADRVVVYSAGDLVQHGTHVHVEPAMPRTVAGSVPKVEPAPASAASVESASSRVILIAFDSTAWNGDNGILFNAIDHALTTQYSANYGFSFDWWVTYCSTASCDATWGMSSADSGTLLVQSSAVLSNYLQGWGYELAHVISGKGTSWENCGDGVAWQPGRYSAQVYSYSFCDWYTASVTIGHEVGHNFAGDHTGAPNPDCPSYGASGPTGAQGRARCWAQWFSKTVYVCPSPFDLIYAKTGICAYGGHYEDQGGYEPVRSMMWGSGISNWVFEESGDNQTYINYCNFYSWSGGSYVPGSVVGFGSWCIG